jgi:8-hydroxy-5-deazaflavin:NADPH oxidoreductase
LLAARIRLGPQIPSFNFPDASADRLFDRVAAIARTSKLNLGLMIGGVTYRNPAQLAKITTTLDVVSSGRALLGLGAAWHEEEHHAYGVPFPPICAAVGRDSAQITKTRLGSVLIASSNQEAQHRLAVVALTTGTPLDRLHATVHAGDPDAVAAHASELLETGHDIALGSRSPQNSPAAEWVQQTDGPVRLTDHLSATASADIVINTMPGRISLDVLRGLGSALGGKILIDVANAIEQDADGRMTSLSYPNGSLAQEIQRALPATKVVKSLNTMQHKAMVDPASLPEPLPVFLSGDDREAKQTVVSLLAGLGWTSERIVDLGGVATAQGPEPFILLARDLIPLIGPVPFGLTVVH